MESQLEGEANFSSGTVGERDGAAGAGGDWNSADVLAVLRELADPERARPFCVGIGLVIESSLKTMPQKFQQVGWLDDQEIRGGTKCPLTAMAEGEEDRAGPAVPWAVKTASSARRGRA